MWKPIRSSSGRSRMINTLFAELDTEIKEEEAGAEEPELQLPSMYPELERR